MITFNQHLHRQLATVGSDRPAIALIPLLLCYFGEKEDVPLVQKEVRKTEINMSKLYKTKTVSILKTEISLYTVRCLSCECTSVENETTPVISLQVPPGSDCDVLTLLKTNWRREEVQCLCHNPRLLHCNCSHKNVQYSSLT